MRVYAKMYAVTGDRPCLAKALGDGILKVQGLFGTGNIPTHFWHRDFHGECGMHDWTNGGVFTALGLEELSVVAGR